MRTTVSWIVAACAAFAGLTVVAYCLAVAYYFGIGAVVFVWIVAGGSLNLWRTRGDRQVGTTKRVVTYLAGPLVLVFEGSRWLKRQISPPKPRFSEGLVILAILGLCASAFEKVLRRSPQATGG